MKTQIVTSAEIKTILGITGSTNDASIELGNDAMTEVLLGLLGLDNFDVTAYTDEEVVVYSEKYLELKNYPIEISSPVPTLKDLNFTALTSFPDSWFLEKTEKPYLKGKNSAGNLVMWEHGELLVSYTAGWRVASTITVVDYSTMDTKTFSIKAAGVTTEYTMASGTPGTDEIKVETSNEITAGHIATALGGTVSGAVVTLPAGHYATQGTLVDTEMTVTQFNLPSAFRTAISMLVGGFLAGKQKNGGVVNYSLGGKSVSFGTTEDLQVFKNIISAYLPGSSKFNCA